MFLGAPKKQTTCLRPTKPYPGDEKALQPVFTYRQGTEWKLLVYFAKYCFYEHPEELPGDRLCSIDLIPERRVHFDASQLTAAFLKKHVQAADGAWEEYSDGSGLRYAVYTRHPQYGPHEPGDLFRISYGPPGSQDINFGSVPNYSANRKSKNQSESTSPVTYQ